MTGLQLSQQQNVPLTGVETDYVNNEIRRFKKQGVLLWVGVVLIIVFFFLVTGFKNSGLTFVLAGAAVISGTVIFLMARQQIKLLLKDRNKGKTILHTVIAGKNSNDEPVQDTLSFYTDENGQILILKVTRQQFLQYKPGDEVEVAYLPHYKEVLQIQLVK